MTPSWDRKYLQAAKFFAGWSKDPSTKVGCIIVGDSNEMRSMGFNGPPRGVDDNVEARWARPAKYAWCAHAEENAILNAARMGISLMAATAYVASFPDKLTPCDRCARAIIQSGICRVVTEPSAIPERWRESFQIGEAMMLEAGIVIDTVSLED